MSPHFRKDRFRRSVDKRLRYAFFGVLAVLLSGTFGYMTTEGWSAVHAFYFTLITVTTVGYGDYGLSVAGQRFTIVVLIAGIAVFTYSFKQLVPILFDVTRARERAMYKQIMTLSDHVIVCGLGRMGRAACQELARLDQVFVAIDEQVDNITWAQGEGYLAVCGDATIDRTLEEVNIDTATGMICVTSSDAANIVITLSAHALNPDLQIISRAEQSDSRRKLEHAGATEVVSPSHAGSLRIVHRLLGSPPDDDAPTVGGLRLSEFRVVKGARLDGATVGQFTTAHPQVALVRLMPEKGDPAINPAPSTVIRAGSTLTLAAAPDRLHVDFETWGLQRAA